MESLDRRLGVAGAGAALASQRAGIEAVVYEAHPANAGPYAQDLGVLSYSSNGNGIEEFDFTTNAPVASP